MSKIESWENVCCRCGNEVKVNVHPGKRACHLTCGSCLYPDNPKCASCDIVGHCRLALDYLMSLKSNGVRKGFYFSQQLVGDETLYHTLEFVNGQQHLVRELGEKQYLEELNKAGSSTATLVPTFVPGLPRDSNIGWTRITLTKPISREWVEAISRALGVVGKLEDSSHIVVRGERRAVKRAREMFFQLQSLLNIEKPRDELHK